MCASVYYVFDKKKMTRRNAQPKTSWLRWWQVALSASKALPCLLRPTPSVQGFQSPPPTLALPASSQELSWAISSVLTEQDRALLCIQGLPFNHPRAALSQPWSTGEGPGSSRWAPYTLLIFNDRKIGLSLSCLGLINTCLEFRLLNQDAPP